MPDDWLTAFPGLARLSATERDDLIAAARPTSLPPGAVVFQMGSPCGAFLLVVDGAVRVQMTGESGREIVLYRVERGHTCIMTTACLMSGEAYGAEAVTETPVRAMAVPAEAFRRLLGRSEAFREFVFGAFGTRIADLMLVVEEVAFQRIDVRLAGLLGRAADASGRVAQTHQELAVELGSAREVISRQLKEFERNGWVALARGAVTVLDGAALDRLSRSGPV